MGDAGDDATTSSDSSSDATSDAPAEDASPDGSDAGDASEACDAGCRVCCRQEHPDAAAIIRNDERTCACVQPGDCEAGALCGNNLCADQKEVTSCIQCLDDPDAGDCTQKALAKCATQPECAALEACLVACGDGG